MGDWCFSMQDSEPSMTRQAGAERFAPLVDNILDTVETEVNYARGGCMRNLLARKIAAFVSSQEVRDLAK